MNQISHLSVIYHHQAGRRCADAIPDAFASAWRHVRSGELYAARMTVARMVMQHQPRLAADRALLAETVAVLAAAHGARAISRLLAAASGRWVQVALAPLPGRVDGCDVMAIGPACPELSSTADVADLAALRRWSESVVDSCLPSEADVDLQDVVSAAGHRSEE